MQHWQLMAIVIGVAVTMYLIGEWGQYLGLGDEKEKKDEADQP